MEWNADKPAWAFKMQGAEKIDIETILNGIPDKWKKKFGNILNKYRNFTIADLEKHVYKNHVRSLEKNAQILSNIRSTAQMLEKSVETYPPNYNSYLVQGIVEYCLLALKRTPGDIIQQDYLIRNIYYLLSSVTEIDELVRKDSACLAKIDLRDIEEEFEITQIACREVAKMPLLEEMNLSDLSG
jgi:predicted translin family RNA/ssDNA-binding protein